ncbi:MAG TPA: DUF4150 domain-containing protein [Acetobacteraceae bacterium]|nr:DUF4150 domain-containing protein [Acetobacteraceae bacterium]
MSVTVKADGLTISHKGSSGFSIATLPDVCKTPTPGGPVPMPYPNSAQSSDLSDGTTTVQADGGNMIAIKGSHYQMTTGDEPGTAGGVTSNTFKKETDWITYSFDVKMDGGNVCRSTDKKFHNHKNTIDAMGDFEQPLGDPEIDYVRDVLCEKFCEELAECRENRRGFRSSNLESRLADDEACRDLNLKFPPDTATTMDWEGNTIPETIPDCTLCNQEGQVVQCYDFKGPGDRWRDDQLWRQEQIAGRPPIKISAEECGCEE